MTSLSDQLSAVRKSQWEAQLDIFNTLTSRALDGAGQLIDLQLRASRTSVEQVTGTFKQLLDASSPRDLVAVGSRAQGQWHYLFSYSRELFGIASGLRTETWSTNPAAASVLTSPLLVTAPTANVPTSISQALEQASIATAGATTLHSEIAAAAVDTGAALAEATLHAGAEAVQQAAEAQQQAVQAEQQPEQPEQQAQPEQQQAGTVVADAVPESAAEAAVHFAEAASETAIADAVPPAAETPLAQALHDIAPTPVSAQHPIASTVPLEAQDGIELPAVTPLDAEPPVHIPVPPTPPKASRSSRRSK
jgi:hypothetical protein